MGSPPNQAEPPSALPQPAARLGCAEAAAQPAAVQQQAGYEALSPRGGGGGGSGGGPFSPSGLQEGDTPLTEALLPLTSDDDTPVPSAELAPALTAEEAEQRKRKRDKWEREQEAKRRWDLQRRLVDISTDVEFLAREVERVRNEMEVPLPPLNELTNAERQQLEALRRKRVNDMLQNHCKKALAHITTHKWSWPFNAPVDLRHYPDYAEAVKQPMDFGSIKKRIDSGSYRHPDEFLAHVRLVFDNARLYNKPGSDVHVMANTLQERFEDKYSSSVAPRVAEEAAVTRHQQEEARRRHVEASARDSGDALEQHCAVLVKYIDEVSACILDARSAAAALCKPVTRQEKEALVRALTSMPQEHFELAIGLVMAHHPGLQPYDDFGFDLDALDALTLRQMQSFVRACQAAQTERKQRSGSGGGPSAGAASVTWPQLLLGAGLRPNRLATDGGDGGSRPGGPGAGSIKKQRRRQRGAAAGQQQEAAVVKQEQQQEPSPSQPQQGQERPPQRRRQLADLVGEATALASTLTPEEVAAAAAAAAGMLSPLLNLQGGAAGVPPRTAGSAVAPKPLAAAAAAGGAAAGGAAAAAAAAAAQRQQRQKKPAVARLDSIASSSSAAQAAAPPGSAGTAGVHMLGSLARNHSTNMPMPALTAAMAALAAPAIPASTTPAAAAAGSGPAAGSSAATAAAGPKPPAARPGIVPTAAQMAAVAAAGPQQQHLLAQMHSLLSQVQMTQAAAAHMAAAAQQAKAAGKQQPQQQSQQPPGPGK